MTEIQKYCLVADHIRRHFLNGDSGVGPATPRATDVQQTCCAGSRHRSAELGPTATGASAVPQGLFAPVQRPRVQSGGTGAE